MPERSLGDWLQHLEKIHPTEIDLGLARVAAVARTMGLLPVTHRVLTVAGTNGKGSVVYGSEALLRSHGLRTGRYTSPHLFEFNERIAVDGQPVDDALIVDAFEAIESAREDTTLTYFEFATLAALWVFAKARVDVAILEVGLGGRLDAVNIVDSDVAVVTSIALDHQNWLGDSVELIAPEKAGIARPGRPVVLAERTYPSSLYDTLANLGAVCERAGDSWSWRETEAGVAVRFGPPSGAMGTRESLKVPVPDGIRASNVAAALRASDLILERDLDAQIAQSALETLLVPARRERLTFEGREVVIDVAHNPAAMIALAEYLNELPPVRATVAAFGAMADKDIPAMTATLATAVDGALALAIPGIARAAAPESVWEALDEAGVAIPQAEFDAATVLAALQARSDTGDRLVICGSFHSVASIMVLLPAEPRGQSC